MQSFPLCLIIGAKFRIISTQPFLKKESLLDERGRERVCVCVCDRERERERERGREGERERERGREGGRAGGQPNADFPVQGFLTHSYAKHTSLLQNHITALLYDKV